MIWKSTKTPCAEFAQCRVCYYHKRMDSIRIRIDGKEYIREKGIEVSTFFSSCSREYKDNPIVAAAVNGVAASLSEKLEGNADIVPIRLFSKNGLRAYRKSLCFLLSYASAEIAPERTLIIGHSLGDGYYFRYRDGKKPDAGKLEAIMRKAIADDLPFEIIQLTAEEALEYSNKHILTETVKLLDTINAASYRFAKLGECMEVYYEPLLPSASYLAIWELRPYQDGLLLRYPQSRDPLCIKPFSDNPLLFSVFQENKKYAKILSIESLGDLNAKIAAGTLPETIRLSETLQRNRIAEAADEIMARKQIKAVFIAGPSSSGKTTFSMKLTDELISHGYECMRISLDDYYHEGDKIPIDEDGEKDYEVLESLNLPLLRKQLKALRDGKEVHLARHSFRDKKTTFDAEPSKMNEHTILIIEGIHGLNPSLCPDFPQEECYKIYISALTEVNLDTRSRISTTDNRILRRMVRDNRTRGLDAVETLSRWPSVERGEKNNIFPYQNNADIMINSALEYELAVLAPLAIPLLRSVKKETKEAYTLARRLLDFLELIYPAPKDDVPPDSILREFIGGSIYGAH